MTIRARLFLVALAASLAPAVAAAQVTWQPTAPPLVTANNASWFLAGDPIIWAGDYYYPSGPQRFFNANQMVRAGSFQGIPLYTDATLSPYDLVFVPLNGGLMQPYERRRAGALAGTTGSTAPSYPTEIGAEGLNYAPAATAERMAAGPPMRERAYDVYPAPPFVEPPLAAFATGTAGRTPRRNTSPETAPHGDESAVKPVGLNSVWVSYEGHRWFAAGPAIEPRPGEFVEAGRYRGFPVYTRQGEQDRIYVQTVEGGLLTPFKR